ncbi:MAG: GspE/PulE family protein [Candidatus Peregrinibacteria bacterium]|nr:GspE/PulE family protein [Candidatus Peregrinibacteria bacterium]
MSDDKAIQAAQEMEKAMAAEKAKAAAAEAGVKTEEKKTADTKVAVDKSATSMAGAENKAAMGNMSNINREFQEKSVLKQAESLNLPYVNIGKTPLNPDFLKLIDVESAKKARIIPFFRTGKKVRVAVQDTNNPDTQAAIKVLQDKGYEINVNLASSAGIDDALDIYTQTQKYKKLEIVETVEQKSIKTYEKEIAGLKELTTKLDTVTAEEGLNLLDVGAIKTGASDVHYEPSEKTVTVRFRIDGVLHKVFEIKPDTYRRIANQLKYSSHMQLNVTTVPQDGRYDFKFNEQRIAVRVSSIPTPYTESFVCRYLPSEEIALSFEDLGFQSLALAKLHKVCSISHGMVLVTGPTGSGKTTTLYSILGKMNTPEAKIITLEDPVEYNLRGITQSQIDEKRDYDFAKGLRAILRQDPDIVMLGEIRDLETAQTASQAALTGHVVLSTLHTNSAIETIPRLVNMGLPPFMIGPSLNTIVAQRLVRKVCDKCSTMEPISDSAKKEFEGIMTNLKNVNPGDAVAVPEKVPTAHGCDACSQTGYKGRLVICEVVTINNELKDLVLNKASLVDMIAVARKEGMITMKEDGFIKVSQGLTTLEEVYRVTNVLD